MSKVTSIRLEEEEITFLKQYGSSSSITAAIRSLIQEKKQELSGKGGGEAKKNVDEKFYDAIVLPGESRLRETYQAFLEKYIKNNFRRGALDFYIDTLAGATGFDPNTIRKHFRKLSSQGYIKGDGFLFKPAVRWRINGDNAENQEQLQKQKQEFMQIFREFSDFLQSQGEYEDALNVI